MVIPNTNYSPQLHFHEDRGNLEDYKIIEDSEVAEKFIHQPKNKNNNNIAGEIIDLTISDDEGQANKTCKKVNKIQAKTKINPQVSALQYKNKNNQQNPQKNKNNQNLDINSNPKSNPVNNETSYYKTANNQEAMKFFQTRRARTDPVKNKRDDGRPKLIECPAMSLSRKSIIKGCGCGFGEFIVFL